MACRMLCLWYIHLHTVQTRGDGSLLYGFFWMNKYTSNHVRRGLMDRVHAASRTTDSWDRLQHATSVLWAFICCTFNIFVCLQVWYWMNLKRMCCHCLMLVLFWRMAVVTPVWTVDGHWSWFLSTCEVIRGCYFHLFSTLTMFLNCHTYCIEALFSG